MRPVLADPKTDFVLKRIFGAHQARMAGLTPAEWDAYDRAQISEQDSRGAISLAERQSEARGEAVALRAVCGVLSCSRWLAMAPGEARPFP